jgi:hypothetical protein
MATLLATRDQESHTLFEIPQSDLGLRADRTDITFENVTPDLVRVSVRVTNDGTVPSPGTTVDLQSAPLGAFLAWQPLLSLRVPALMPRQAVVISGTAWVPRLTPLDQAGKVSVAQLQGAVAAPPEAEAPAEAEPPAPGRTARKRWSQPRPALPTVANDPFALLGRGGLHWAGNIDVLMRNKSVERHLAQALRVYPGLTNMALFFVGDRRDGYRFALAGMADEWQAELLHTPDLSLLRPQGAATVLPGEWLELHGHSTFMLLLRPPRDAERGEVQVHVQRQSDEKEAIVEFSLDARAAGTGCYTV